MPRSLRLVAIAYLVVACGGSQGADLDQDPTGSAGTGGDTQRAGAGGTDEGVAGAPGATDAGSAGSGATAGAGGATGATAGQAGALAGGTGPEFAGGGSGGSGGSGGQGSAGAPQAGATQGGGGAAMVDPLDPTPLPGCPGYVQVLVPKGTCVWFHGTVSTQTPTCSLADPPEGKCSTASAPSKDMTSIVSEGALIDRFDLDGTVCPKQCS